MRAFSVSSSGARLVSQRPVAPLRQREAVEVPLGEAGGGGGRGPRRRQVEGGVGTDRLQHPVAGGVGRRFHDHQRLVGQRPHQLGHVVGLDGARRHGGGGGVEVEGAGEARQPLERRPFGGGEEVVAPVEQRRHRALALGHRAVAAAQEAEALVEAVEDLGRRQDGAPRRRQLDGEGHAVEPLADAHGDGAVDVGRPAGGHEAVDEEGHGVGGDGQRGQPADVLARHAERLAARGQHHQRRAPLEQVGHEPSPSPPRPARSCRG